MTTASIAALVSDPATLFALIPEANNRRLIAEMASRYHLYSLSYDKFFLGFRENFPSGWARVAEWGLGATSVENIATTRVNVRGENRLYHFHARCMKFDDRSVTYIYDRNRESTDTKESVYGQITFRMDGELVDHVCADRRKVKSRPFVSIDMVRLFVGPVHLADLCNAHKLANTLGELGDMGDLDSLDNSDDSDDSDDTDDDSDDTDD